jgi:hypothetical protein
MIKYVDQKTTFWKCSLLPIYIFNILNTRKIYWNLLKLFHMPSWKRKFLLPTGCNKIINIEDMSLG